ncbi:Gfo/Idh/MocA family oxidoreductase [Enterococcus sp. BWM-S5]|uniref:Gfo/Idh/MocA family oxidoreductase n=1 Tax=Enterococcus larvae TaxID=2794352 RepID=A0ABS4CNV3_9ENTE|nr:Gfo/Idh/MocA family oxidoreductase [Enterococcus larvae]MBP1048214.1 Gfo/Idh/MocA family oxidoreductase [Enterococcus larvae]
MKIGVIGLGNIAQKAYLPVYSELRNEGDFVLATRNKEIRALLQDKYGFKDVVETIEELIAFGIEACFVHVATEAHVEIVDKLLKAGIHVCVDKPLSENLSEVKELQAYARENKLVLMIAFNRRFAPFVEELKRVENKNLLLIQKNRINSPGNTGFMIYDLFLHVVDTAVYLLDDPIQQVQTKVIEKNGELQRAFLHLETEKTTAICSMDLLSGANTESYQVSALQGTYTLENLTELTIQTDKETKKEGFNDWATTLDKRGFAPLVRQFIAGVKSESYEHLKQEDVFLSHELCSKILHDHQKHIL